MTVIVAGALHVDPAERDAYLAGCQALIATARRTAGCVDFHLSPDPIEAGRINVYEEWESVEAVDAFRGSGPPVGQLATIREAHVFQHEVSTTIEL